MGYSLFLSNGRSWRIDFCRGVGPAVEAWVEEFAAHLGLNSSSEESGSRLWFGRLETRSTSDGFSRFMPGLPGEAPAEGWFSWGVAGLVFSQHPQSRNIFCGLMTGNRALILRQFRHALLHVFDEVIKTGGLIVHGALLERKGSGILLLGRSGAGKTTCCQRLPAGWRVLGDDLALIVKSGTGQFLVHPLPTWSAVDSDCRGWSCRINESVPLEVLFVLRQSGEDCVERLRGAEATVAAKQASDEALMPLDIAHSRRGIPGRKEMFLNAVALSAVIPTYRLNVSLMGCFWEKIEEVLWQVKETRSTPFRKTDEREKTAIGLEVATPVRSSI